MPLPEEQRQASGRLDAATDPAKHVPFNFSVTAMPMLSPAGPKGVSSLIRVRFNVGAESAASAKPTAPQPNALSAQALKIFLVVRVHPPTMAHPGKQTSSGCAAIDLALVELHLLE